MFSQEFLKVLPLPLLAHMQYELADVRPCKCKHIKIGYERLHTQFPEVLNHARIKTCYTAYCHPPLLGILMLAMTIPYQLVVLNASCFAKAPRQLWQWWCGLRPALLPQRSQDTGSPARIETYTLNRFLTHIRGEGLLHMNQDNCIYNMHMYYISLLLLIIITINYY